MFPKKTVYGERAFSGEQFCHFYFAFLLLGGQYLKRSRFLPSSAEPILKSIIVQESKQEDKKESSVQIHMA